MHPTSKNESGFRLAPLLLIWLALFVVIILVETVRGFVSADARGLSDSLRIFLQAAIGASLLFPAAGLWWLVRRGFRGCNWRRAGIGLAGLVLLVALFYAEEDWRGWHAWKLCQRELAAKGLELDWAKLIPPPVPDDQNFFKAPKMQEWFVRHNTATTTELHALSTNVVTTAASLDETTAVNYLAWSDQFEPDFDLMREALKRPYARMDGDYAKPSGQPIPNFVNVRTVAQVLARRAKCDLLLGQPDKALQELTLLHDMCRLLEGAPTGKPMTLVAAMINVAITGLYVDTVAGGLQSHAWQEPQLVALQKQLAEVNLAPFVAGGFECEPLSALHEFKNIEPRKIFALSTVLIGPHQKPSLWDRVRSLNTHLWDLIPRGWIYQNMASYLRSSDKIRVSLFDEHYFVTPKKTDRAMREVEKAMEHPGLFNLFSAIAIPNYSKATQTFAFNQTKANEAQIVCALERYRLAHGGYSETLDALSPQFIEILPHDLIGGEPLIYRRTADGKFLLYSVGWNEKDDDGLPGTVTDKRGDWVWQYPVK
jgi:hypothetical protein